MPSTGYIVLNRTRMDERVLRLRSEICDTLWRDLAIAKEAIQGIDDVLWPLCLHADRYSARDRCALLRFLRECRSSLSHRQMLRCAGNLLTAYFSSMDEQEKETYLYILLDLGAKACGPILADIIEMTGIATKDAPDHMRGRLFDMVSQSLSAETAQIPPLALSMCNAFRFMFLEVNSHQREQILQQLAVLREANQASYVEDSILFTLETLRRLESA